jgi:hypothetical protein
VRAVHRLFSGSYFLTGAGLFSLCYEPMIRIASPKALSRLTGTGTLTPVKFQKFTEKF